MLVEGVPQKNPRRTLTLIAKLIQNLSNKPTVQKEPFMSVLNPFVTHNEARFQKFLHEICEVGDFNDALEVFLFLLKDGTVYCIIKKRYHTKHYT
jgi:Ras GTPase-activating-like protein IQGAP2/3